jgi:hypothetical protein
MGKDKIRWLYSPVSSEKGTAIVYALIVLVLLTLLGVSSITTTTTEQKMAQNHMYYELTFYSAEAAREFVPPNTQLYHSDNISAGDGILFPAEDGLDNDGDGEFDESDGDDTDADSAEDEELIMVNATQSFKGNVVYDQSTQPLRGSGYDVGNYKAHKYTISGEGRGPRDTEHAIQAGFYRIGF